MKKYTPTYWNRKGKFQVVYDEMHRELVPDEGEANTTAGEIIRIVGNVYYDHFNNGGCNLAQMKDDRLWLRVCLPEDAWKHIDRFFVPFDPNTNYTAMYKADQFVDFAICYAQTLEMLRAM